MRLHTGQLRGRTRQRRIRAVVLWQHKAHGGREATHARQQQPRLLSDPHQRRQQPRLLTVGARQRLSQTLQVLICILRDEYLIFL